MKRMILLLIILTSCKCGEDEDFTPYPGGKCPLCDCYHETVEMDEQFSLQP